MIRRILNKFIIFFVGLIIICIMIFCKNSETPKTKALSKQPIIIDTVKINNELNNIALFIAGLDVNDSSRIEKLTKDSVWIKYAQEIDSNWVKLEKKRLSYIDKWSIKEMADINKTSKTIFYPFSGADFIHVYNFFPDAEKYILIGLERPGTLPQFSSKTKSTYLKTYLGVIKRGIDDLFNMSFFRTSDMTYDMNNSYVNGTLPIIMLFMARSHNDIISIKPITINSDGKISYLDSLKGYTASEKYNKGVEIKFKDFKTKQPKSLIYLCADLSDEGFMKQISVYKYLSGLDTNICTYIKSASYLMYLKEFVKIRTIITSNTKYLLQDDSGVPMKYIMNDNWNIKYYGVYERPIKSFNRFYQPELKTAFETADKISFKVGYGYISHQILCRRK